MVFVRIITKAVDKHSYCRLS